MIGDTYRRLRSIAGRIRYSLRRKVIAWRRLQKLAPDQPILASLACGMQVRIYPRDVIGESIYVTGIFEPRESAFINRFLTRGMVFLDAGANLGYYTILAAVRIGESGKVHSFEPSSRMYEEMTFNVNLNHLTDRCVLNRMALSDTAETAKLSRYCEGAEVYGSLGNHQFRDKQIVGYEEVQTTTIDSYLEANGIERVHLIKMDVEGAELFALHGASRLLVRSDAPPILIEVADETAVGFGYEATSTWDFLADFGYHFFEIDSSGNPRPLCVRPANFGVGMDLLAMK